MYEVNWQIVLEYMKVFLSTQVIAGVLAIVFFKMFRDDIKALILRIAKIRLPGGGELSTPQLEKQEKDNLTEEKPSTEPALNENNLPVVINHNNQENIEALLKAEKSRSAYWEYRYLNHFLVNTTQRVLDWLISTKISSGVPVSYSLYDSLWLPIIPDPEQRQTIINVLRNHYLVSTENGLITVTPKGLEYAEWRGELS